MTTRTKSLPFRRSMVKAMIDLGYQEGFSDGMKKAKAKTKRARKQSGSDELAYGYDAPPSDWSPAAQRLHKLIAVAKQLGIRNTGYGVDTVDLFEDIIADFKTLSADGKKVFNALDRPGAEVTVLVQNGRPPAKLDVRSEIGGIQVRGDGTDGRWQSTLISGKQQKLELIDWIKAGKLKLDK